MEFIEVMFMVQKALFLPLDISLSLFLKAMQYTWGSFFALLLICAS